MGLNWSKGKLLLGFKVFVMGISLGVFGIREDVDKSWRWVCVVGFGDNEVVGKFWDGGVSFLFWGWFFKW